MGVSSHITSLIFLFMIESLSHNLKEASVLLRRREGLITKSDEGEEGITVEKLGSIGF